MFLSRRFGMENSQEAVEPLRLNHADGILDILTRAMSTQTVIKLASYRLYVFTCFVLIAENFIAPVLCTRRKILYDSERSNVKTRIDSYENCRWTCGELETYYVFSW